MSRRSPSSYVVVLVLSLGCSEGSGGSGPGGAGFASGCEQACETCGGDPCLDCGQSSSRYRDEFESALFSCVASAPRCDDSLWETCASEAAAGVADRNIDEDFRTACFAKRADCEAQGVSIADDNCLTSRVYSDEWIAQAQQCLSNACGEVTTCIRSI